MRDAKWLDDTLVSIWEQHFSDVTKSNPILIRFGRKSGRRLGSIVLVDDSISRITITGIFMDESVPEYVVHETIAHELIHYIHGFSSKMKKTFKYPHQGGIIQKEMELRGLGEIHEKSKQWMRKYWHAYITPPKRKRGKRVRNRRIRILGF